jgi:hypothetical protein
VLRVGPRVGPTRQPAQPKRTEAGREPGVQWELTRVPKEYLLLRSGSVIASQRRSGVVLM